MQWLVSGLNYYDSVSPGNRRSSTPFSVLTWLWVPFSLKQVSLIEPFLQAAPDGNADINVPYYPDNNRYLAVHEYSGFELGDAERLHTIRDFITYHGHWRRSGLERLHAIW